MGIRVRSKAFLCASGREVLIRKGSWFPDRDSLGALKGLVRHGNNAEKSHKRELTTHKIPLLPPAREVRSAGVKVRKGR